MQLSNDASGDNDYIRQAMLSRMPEKIQVTMLVMAIADSAFSDKGTLKSPVVTKEHFEYAMKYHEELNRSLIAQTAGGSMADPLLLCIERLTSHCSNFGNYTFDRTYAHDFKKKQVSRGWITKILDKTKFKPMAELLTRKNENRDAAMREIMNYCEDINLLIPVPTAGKKQIWRINT